MGVFIFKTDHKEDLVQPDTSLGSWEVPLGSPAFCPGHFYSLLTTQCAKCPSKPASGLATFLLETAPIQQRETQSSAGAHRALPGLPDSFLLLLSADPAPVTPAACCSNTATCTAHLGGFAQTSHSAWKTDPRGSVPRFLQVSAQTLPSQSHPQSLLLSQPHPPPRTPGLLVLTLLFLPHSLDRNLAGCVFADLRNLSVSPGEGSFFNLFHSLQYLQCLGWCLAYKCSRNTC